MIGSLFLTDTGVPFVNPDVIGIVHGELYEFCADPQDSEMHCVAAIDQLEHNYKKIKTAISFGERIVQAHVYVLHRVTPHMDDAGIYWGP